MKHLFLKIDSERCKGCGICLDTCKKNLISLSNEINTQGYHFAQLAEQKECTACALCATVCPDLAIEIWAASDHE